jgi:MoaA/NifB/PqqE/SkfB family radical SAM enzyme
VHVVITTNGSHLARRLVPLLDRVTVEAILVSLDSHTPAVHDEVRGLRQLWSLSVAGIAACRAAAAPPRVVLNHVLTRHNMAELPAFIRFAGEIGAHAVNLIAVKDRLTLQASLEQRQDLASRVAELRAVAAAAGVALLFRDDDVAAWSAPRGAGPEQEYRCVFPRFAAYIDLATGGVFPCDCTVHRVPRSTFELGDIWSQTLDEIWHGEPMRRIRGVLETRCDPGCKRDCDWNNRRTNAHLLALPGAGHD